MSVIPESVTQNFELLKLDLSLIKDSQIDANSFEDDKKLKKKLKKYVIDEGDSSEKTKEKIEKMLDELKKQYESSSKALLKLQQSHNSLENSKKELNKAEQEKKMLEKLHESFRDKYKQQYGKAEEAEKQEQVKRKELSEKMQQRITSIQTQYEQEGNKKMQKTRQNQILKHENTRLEPHLMTSQKLFQAQLEKKSIEINMNMATLTQKVEMMSNFTNMKQDTEKKHKQSKIAEQKIGTRLAKINKKEEQHKVVMAKAHLAVSDYNQVIKKLNQLLGKKEKVAFMSDKKLAESQNSLKKTQEDLKRMDKDIQNQKNQLEVLAKLEEDLKRQLAE